ncbi:MAG: 2-(1,2-epoxy-1,2-dihydrophenyl)acetyl-CoA isomerase [Saprospiraceae bacterium]|nr:MAG: 2-(1,2-epoxy-1,2-dihydrophenyl)acetyl-CoA isomerase [Saprospiraceae bacterium]
MTILFEKSDDVAWITLNRPQVYNAFNREMALALQDVLKRCADDPHVRAIYLTGAGKAFCSGQDLQEAIQTDNLHTILSEHYNPIIRLLRSIEKPIVCAVNGVAAGAGANIALACDITVAAESASFLQAFSKIGLIPDSSGTFFLPRLVGMQRATALMMLAEKVPATEAAAMGMIYRCFPDDAFVEESRKIAVQLAGMPTRGLGLTKRALNASLSNDLESQLQLEDRLQTEAGQTHDYREGVQAFLEKRPPRFKGQ